MPPRTAYSPTSRTVAVRSKAFVSSHFVSRSMATTLPAAAPQVRAATVSRSGTRWMMALAVVKTTRGPFCGCSRSCSALIRAAEISELGETRS